MTTIYDVLRRPIITEKSNYQNSVLGQFVFEVAPDATKTMVSDAVEALFDVEVLRVNIVNMPAKRKRNMRTRQMTFRRSAYKKAIFTLAPGDTIAVTAGNASASRACSSTMREASKPNPPPRYSGSRAKPMSGSSRPSRRNSPQMPISAESSTRLTRHGP